MFILEQIKEAHASTVKTGADFPKYVKKITELGVARYETYVTDGHTDYHSADGKILSSQGWYENLNIATKADKATFAAALKAHQQGKTTYPVFCNDAAVNGVEKWVVDTNAMTCTYYDLQGDNMLQEIIPQA